MSWRNALLKASFVTCATAALLAGIAWWAARPAKPDDFYTWNGAPGDPGKLLRAEPYGLDVLRGMQAQRILYATTRLDGRPAVASAIIMQPLKTATPSPVVAWAHGTTGVAPGCAPSVTMPFANVPALGALQERGWTYVATDYVGLGTDGGHAYLVGADAARNVLDAVRAARTLDGLALDNRVVVWGHSQGGNSALWTGMIASSYAPDVNVLGIAALAPASDLKALLSSSQKGMFGKIVSSYLLHAYAFTYPDVKRNELVSGLTAFLTADIAGRCVGGVETLYSVAETALLPADGIFDSDPLQGALGKRLGENTPAGPFPVPVLLAQGEKDDLVLESVQASYATARCAEGQPIDYRVIAGRDHISLVAPDSPLSSALAQWTADRFENLPASPAC